MYKPISARTLERYTADLNIQEQSGYSIVHCGEGGGTFWAVLHREEDWSYPFRLACRSDLQSGLVMALIESLEVAVQDGLPQAERVRICREKLAPVCSTKKPEKISNNGSDVANRNVVVS